ncbi:ABC transporter permease [Mycobacterium dioxanotrophicus]|nr:ABC transporter permease [Mycobacterium dioxanotrophicus]
MSFSNEPTLRFPPAGFSLDPYRVLLRNDDFARGLVVSLIVSLIVTALVVAAAVPAALAIERRDFPFKRAIEGFFLMPLLVPTVVLGLGLLLVLAPAGLRGTFTGLVVAHFSIAFPYCVRTVLMSLHTSDISCEEAAAVLGAKPAYVFRRITLPIIMPGVVTGSLMAFIVSFDESVLSMFVSGTAISTLPVEMFQYLEVRADPVIAALSVALIGGSMIIVMLIERLVGLRFVVR